MSVTITYVDGTKETIAKANDSSQYQIDADGNECPSDFVTIKYTDEEDSDNDGDYCLIRKDLIKKINYD